MGVVIPKLEDYSIKILVALGDQTDNLFDRNHIKFLIVKKLLLLNYSMFFLINRFLSSKQILKEAYAEVIIMKFKDGEYCVDDVIMDEVIALASLDTLMYYGMESTSIVFREKCKKEFWNRAIELENKVELNRKMNLEKRRKYKIKNKRKGD